MNDIEKLKRSLLVLNKNVSDFPIGAVTLDDYKPIEEKIQDLRVSLKCLSSRLQMLEVKINLDRSTTSPQTAEINVNSIDQLNVKLSNCLINDHASKFCIHSRASQDSFFANNIDAETQIRMKALMKKLFIMNDKILGWQHDIVELSNREIKLKDECGQYITEFHDFLKVQEGLRNQKLAELNPEVAAKKKRVNKLLYKINIMKKLITNFICAASPDVKSSPRLEEMLKKHRELVTIDTIMEMAHNHSNYDREY